MQTRALVLNSDFKRSSPTCLCVFSLRDTGRDEKSNLHMPLNWMCENDEMEELMVLFGSSISGYVAALKFCCSVIFSVKYRLVGTYTLGSLYSITPHQEMKPVSTADVRHLNQLFWGLRVLSGVVLPINDRFTCHTS